MFSIVAYFNGSAPNVVDKNITEITTMNGVLRAGSSIIDPVLVIETDNNTMWEGGFNYLYIEQFKRFYYVTNIISIPGVAPRSIEPGPTILWEIHCHVDVLMSFKDQIRQQTAIVARQESQYNLYLDDGVFMSYQNPKIQTKVFSNPTPFETQEFVLVVAGS